MAQGLFNILKSFMFYGVTVGQAQHKLNCKYTWVHDNKFSLIYQMDAPTRMKIKYFTPQYIHV